jgi:hypothetical protein
MGSVWLAERNDGRFDRRVAVKFLNLGLARQGADERFRREGAILARLSHPHIAELIDAGVSNSGQPYLVLEFVEGQPIDRYCDEHKLDLRARITLFLDVLDAVAHAHANLIVHRDLKPSNVLVSNDGRVKLLDFGIAKLLDAEGEVAATLLTRAGESPLTPEYAAPEQVTGAPVTTATDVYALGLLLYELLTGRHPAEKAFHSPAALVKAIVDTEPVRPSTLVEASAGSDEKTNTTAQNRASTPEKLSRLLRGDLDTIAVKALKKDPRERYASPTAMGGDLRRYLRYEPITARPDTGFYRASKFVRRNWTALTLTALALAAILAGLAIAVYQARVARHRFDDLRKLAHSFVFDVHDEVAKLQGSTKAREIIVGTGLKYLDGLARDAGNDLNLQREVAEGYVKIAEAQGLTTRPNLGHLDDAMASYRKAGDIYRRIAAKDKAYLPDLAEYEKDYASFLRYSSNPAGARTSARAAIETIDRIRAGQPLTAKMERTYAAAWCTLGDLDEVDGQYHLAWEEFSHCAEISEQRLRLDNDVAAKFSLVQAEERVGSAAQELGFLPEALLAYDKEDRELGELLQAEPLNPRYQYWHAVLSRFRSRVYLDNLQPDMGDPVQGLIYAKRYQEEEQQIVAHDPNDVSALYRLASADYNMALDLENSDPQAAVRLARESLSLFDKLIASGHKDPLNLSGRLASQYQLIDALLKAGEVAEARRVSTAALAETRNFLADDPRGDIGRRRLVLALVLASEANEATDPAGAEKMLQEAQGEAQAIAANHDLTRVIPLAIAERALGAFYLHERRSQDARAHYQALVNLWQSFPGSNVYLDRQRASSGKLLAAVQ